ncbi:hypothetical protein BD626DRAFT_8453 [Schizophyllum amplum]|uniref:Secreted protein n=1 Tax=Schizophyllum amplum TaxID=97359 RepID=A0A550CWT3_9AGAR|nr:hypothetical protein BD626DRAFT_8453 [Auriculariopsis ampla]
MAYRRIHTSGISLLSLILVLPVLSLGCFCEAQQPMTRSLRLLLVVRCSFDLRAPLGSPSTQRRLSVPQKLGFIEPQVPRRPSPAQSPGSDDLPGYPTQPILMAFRALFGRIDSDIFYSNWLAILTAIHWGDRGFSLT